VSRSAASHEHRKPNTYRIHSIGSVSLHYGKDSFRDIEAKNLSLTFVFIVNAVQQLADLEQAV